MMQRTVQPEEKPQIIIPSGTTFDELFEVWSNQTEYALPGYLAQLEGKKRLFILALIHKYGNITAACRAVDIARITYYDWMNKDEVFKLACWEVDQSLIDNTEDMLHFNIQNGRESSIQFFLERKAKDRGYAKKVDIGISGSVNHKYSIDLNKLNIQEVEYFKRIMSKAGIEQSVGGHGIPALTAG